MTHLWIRTAAVGLLASLGASLAACESTPRYPAAPGQAAGTGPRLSPAYPVREAPQPAPAAPRVDEYGDAMPPALPTTPVDKTPLSPVTTENLAPVQTPAPQRMSFDRQDAVARALFGELDGQVGDGEAGLVRVATTHHPLAPADAPSSKAKPKPKAAPAKPAAKGKTPPKASAKAPAKKAGAGKSAASKTAPTKKTPPAKPCKGKHCKAEPEAKAASTRSTGAAGLRGRKGDEETPAASRGRRAEPEAAPVKSSAKATPGVIAGGAVVSAEGPPASYKIKNGDTLDGIARKLDTTRKQLIDDNKLKSPYVIRPGKTLQGPPTAGKAYVVQAGDTLFAIARRFSVEASKLAAYNDIKTGTALKPGRKLLLPPGFKDKGIPKPPAPRPVAHPTTLPPARPAYEPPAIQSPPPEDLPPIGATPARPPLSTPGTTPLPPQISGPPRPQPYYRPATPSQPPAGNPVRPPVATPTQPMIETAPPLSDNEIAAAGRGHFTWPVRGDILRGYGPMGGGQRNDGVDIQAPAGTPVLAAADGEVVYAGDQVPGFGNLVLIKHKDGWVTAYAHLARTDVKMRQVITQGSQIGQVGSTGITGEPQLHFEVRYSPSPREKARAVNPALVLP